MSPNKTGTPLLDRSIEQGSPKFPIRSLIWVNTGAFILGLLLILTPLELIFRRFYHDNQETTSGGHRISANSALLYEPIPHASNGVDRFNSDGVRDHEYPVAKPAGIKRVLIVGDDVVSGFGIATDETLPRQLGAAFKAKAQPVEALNFGVSGYDTQQEVEFFRLKGIKYQPDLVVLVYVLNDNRNASQELRDLADLGFLGGPKPPSLNPLKRATATVYHSSRLLQFLGSQLRIERRLTFLRKYPRLMDYVQDKNLQELDPADSEYAQLENPIRALGKQMGTSSEALLFSLHALGISTDELVHQSHWNASYRALTRLKALSEESSFRVVAVVLPIMFEMDRYPMQPAHDFLRKSFESLGFQTIDLLEVCKQLYNVHGYSAISPDAIHLTPFAIRKVTEYLASQISLEHQVRSEGHESTLLNTPPAQQP